MRLRTIRTSKPEDSLVSWFRDRDSNDVLRLLFFVGSVRSGGSHKQLLAARQREVTSVHALRFVLGEISVDDDFGAQRQRFAREAAAEQSVGRAGFHFPRLDRA